MPGRVRANLAGARRRSRACGSCSWLFTVTDPQTGKRRRTTYRLTIEDARARCEKLNLTSLRMKLAIFLPALLGGSQVAQPAYGVNPLAILTP